MNTIVKVRHEYISTYSDLTLEALYSGKYRIRKDGRFSRREDFNKKSKLKK